jgi:hypothetical protein
MGMSMRPLKHSFFLQTHHAPSRSGRSSSTDSIVSTSTIVECSVANLLADGCIFDQVNVDRVKYAFDHGQQIASHSWSHPHLPELTGAALEAEFSKYVILLDCSISFI